MPPKKRRATPEEMQQVVADARRAQELREESYRGRALRLFPHVCARCGREFSGKTLRELTVHHKDHNHENNPPDGSNWELLCLYCHDDEHGGYDTKVGYGAGPDGDEEAPLGHRPFEGLKDLLPPGNDEADSEKSSGANGDQPDPNAPTR